MPTAPATTPPLGRIVFVDPKTGILTKDGFWYLYQMLGLQTDAVSLAIDFETTQNTPVDTGKLENATVLRSFALEDAQSLGPLKKQLEDLQRSVAMISDTPGIPAAVAAQIAALIAAVAALTATALGIQLEMATAETYAPLSVLPRVRDLEIQEAIPWQ